MQENEFEKILQQKMDALQVQPGEEVWQKIHSQVVKKNDHKRRFLFFFLCCLFLAGGLFITEFYSTNSKKESLTAKHDRKQVKAKPVTVENVKPEKQSQEVKKTGQQPATGNLPAVPGNISTGDNASVTPVKQNNLLSANSNGRTQNVMKKTKGAVKANVIAAMQDEQESDIKDNVAAQKTETIVPLESLNTIAEKTVVQTDQKKDETLKEPVKQDKKDVAQINKSTGKAKEHPWGIALSVSGGRSSTGNSGSSSQVRSNADAAYLNSNVGIPPGTNSGSNNTSNIFLPSVTKPGYGFAAEIQLYRRLSAKSKIVTGLRYQLFSTSINTGQKLDSTASSGRLETQTFAYIGYGNTKSYTNHYHLLSLPVSVSATLFNVGNKEISVDAGINFSKLLSTNTLNFNSVQGVYYNDKSVFNNFFIGLSASAGINLAGKNKKPITVGPEFYYSLTPLASSGIYSNSHYRFWGIKLQKNITK